MFYSGGDFAVQVPGDLLHVKLLAQCRVRNLPGCFFPLAEDEEGKEEQFFFSPTEDEEVKEGQEDSSDEDDAIKEEITDDAAENIKGSRILKFY